MPDEAAILIFGYDEDTDAWLPVLVNSDGELEVA